MDPLCNDIYHVVNTSFMVIERRVSEFSPRGGAATARLWFCGSGENVLMSPKEFEVEEAVWTARQGLRNKDPEGVKPNAG